MAEHPSQRLPGGLRSESEEPTLRLATERFSAARRTQTVLLVPEGHYRLLFDKNPLPAWVFDLDTLAFLAVNDAAVRHYGFSRQEFLDRTIEDLYLPEDRAALRTHLATAPSEGEQKSGSWRHRKRDGTVIDVARAWQDLPFHGHRARLVIAQDVTLRQQAETELQEAERRLRQLAENVRDTFWMTDASASRLLYVSPAYEEVWGRSCDSLYQHPESWQEAIHPDDRERAAEVFDRFVREGSAYQQEYRVIRPDGTVRWVRDRGFPIRDGTGRVDRVAGIAEDVTDQKQRDDEIGRHMRQQEVIAVLGRAALGDTDAQVILDGAARLVAQALKVEYAGIWELAVDGAALHLRAGAGWPAGTIDGATVGTGAASLAGYTLLTTDPVVVDEVATEERFDGRDLLTHGVVSALSVPVGVPERPFGVLAACATEHRRFGAEDVHFVQTVANVLAEALARREAEEALSGSKRFSQAVLNSLAAHVAVLDQQGFILAVNEGWERFARENGATGHSAAGVGTNYLEACGADAEGADVQRGLRAVLNGTLPLFTHEYPCHAPAQQRWFVLRATPCATRRGCAVVAHVDITERKLAEERLREADRRKDDFLAMLAHELRNPLAPIRSALAALGHFTTNDPAAVQLRATMERQVAHLTRLVEDLVDVSRLTRGRITLRKEPVALAELLDRVADSIRPLIAERGQELVVVAADALLRLNADAARLEQVLFNLLHNAVKYTDRGGRIRLTARPEGDNVVLTVADTGIGIVREMLPCIFDPLVQAERRLDRSQGGIGIGLTLVRQLVELHGGTVTAASAGIGRGSEFTIRLPGADGADKKKDAPRCGHASSLHLEPSRRILVVDDNRDAAETLSMILRLMGQEVHAAYDGPTALAFAREHPPAVAFLDVGMPGMDGYELACHLRNEPALAGMLLVAVTGWGQEEDRRRSRAAGFDHHLTKPATADALRTLLASVG